MSIYNIAKTLRDDIGQTFYMVDSNFRTAAQGWTQADGSGPLDLWAAKNPGKVFYTPETGNQGTAYATQAAALLAANDAMVDFRGDTLYFTPGNYSIGTAVVVNVPYARWLGKEYKSPQFGCAPPVRNTTITATVTNCLTASTANAVDGWEVGYIRFVPITADEMILVSAAQVNMYWHDFLYDTVGVTADAATVFQLWSGAADYTTWENFTMQASAAHGPMLDISATVVQHGRFGSFLIQISRAGAAYINALLDVLSGGDVDNFLYGPGLVFCSTGIASTTLTSLFDSQDDMAGAECVGMVNVLNAGPTPTVSAYHSGTDADYSFTQNFMSTSGGTVVTV